MEKTSFFDKIEKIKMPLRITILLGTIILLSAVFAWFYYLPNQDEIKKLQESNAQLQQKLNQVRIKAAKLKQLEEDLAKVDAEFKAALKLLPDNKEIPTLLKTITQLGTDSQLEFRQFNPQGEKAKDFYVEIPVAIEISGNYHNVAMFFDKIGQMKRIVNIVNVKINPVKDRSTTLTTSCNAVTYRFKGESDAPKTNN